MPKYYIGIDGGGTKTDAVLINSLGNLIRRVKGKGTNLNNESKEEITTRFNLIFSELLVNIQIHEIEGIFAGLSSADHLTASKIFDHCIRQACPLSIRHLLIGNDAMNALWSGTENSNGLVIIAGTGSIAYGVKENGDDFRVGGWGYLFGDEGSGYAIGREAIRRTLMAYDGRLQATNLSAVLTDYFSVPKFLDIVPVIYQSSKDRIAGLTPMVEQSALRGDTIAAAILEEAADALIDLIRFSQKRFSLPVDIVLTGGIWCSTIIRKRVTRLMNEASFIFPKYPPVYGSLVKCLTEWLPCEKKRLLPKIMQEFSRI